PSEIPIVCNGVLGTFMVASGVVRTQAGKSISPSEFERLAGKAASKKWKVTLRVIRANGQLGPTLGEHLVELGLEEPAAPRAPSHLAQAIANLDALRRRHGLARGRPPPAVAAVAAAKAAVAAVGGASFGSEEATEPSGSGGGGGSNLGRGGSFSTATPGSGLARAGHHGR
ncbi:hypothetical protein Vretimale_3734, partial [Volvox reticuliferus]